MSVSSWYEWWNRPVPASKGSLGALLTQVGKTEMGAAVAAGQVDVIVAALIQRLKLTPEDVVLDLGCGNGLLSQAVAPGVAQVVGVDFSEPLLAEAMATLHQANIVYRKGNVAEMLPTMWLPHVPTKAYCYEVVQHLDDDALRSMLLAVATGGDRDITVFIGGVPDLERQRAFYDTPERWVRYQKAREAGTDRMGRWWTRDELAGVAASSGFDAVTLQQPKRLYTSRYRFDALLKKKHA